VAKNGPFKATNVNSKTKRVVNSQMPGPLFEKKRATGPANTVSPYKRGGWGRSGLGEESEKGSPKGGEKEWGDPGRCAKKNKGGKKKNRDPGGRPWKVVKKKKGEGAGRAQHVEAINTTTPKSRKISTKKNRTGRPCRNNHSQLKNDLRRTHPTGRLTQEMGNAIQKRTGPKKKRPHMEREYMEKNAGKGT